MRKQKNKSEWFVIIAFLILLIPGITFAEMVYFYGFEDYTGNVDTTSGYPFGEYNLDRWNNHKDRTEVLSNCNTWQAYEGDYFLYGNWYVIQDDCLQNTAGSPHLHLGENYAFGNNAGFNLKSSVPGNELYVRYKVRLGNEWKTNTNHMVKFLRTKWAGGGYADYYSNLVMYSGEGNYITTPGADESAWSGLFDLDDIGIDFSDGVWHDFACWLDISDLHNVNPGPLKIKVWVDNILIIEREVPVNVGYIIENRPIGFDRMMLLENFCGTTNDGPVTFAYDNLEIWDNIPDAITCSDYNNNQIECEANGCNYCDGTCQSESCSVTIRADVDQSSLVNTIDALLILRNSLNLSMTDTDWQESDTTGDVNCDGNSNSTDAMLIMRHSLGLSMVGTGWCE